MTDKRLRKALNAMVQKWGPHSGSCCVFDTAGKVIVTPESCKCGPVVREARAALAADDTLDQLFAAYDQAVEEGSQQWKAEWRRRILAYINEAHNANITDHEFVGENKKEDYNESSTETL